MAYRRRKQIKGHSYDYLVKGVREGGKVRQRVVRYLGPTGRESPVTKDYRDNIGPMTPIIAEELAKAELRWPEEQIMTAIHEAVLNNKLSWAYIITILQRYDRDGFTPPRRERREQLLKDPVAAAKAAGWKVKTSGPAQPGARQSITLAEWFKLWSEDYLKDATLGAQSFYRETFVNYILPELGATPLQEITRSHVRQLLDKVLTGRYPGRRPIRSALQECLVGAINKGLLDTNPASLREYVDSVCKWCGRVFRAQKPNDGGPPSDHCNRIECVDKDREEWKSVRTSQDAHSY